ncbi:hypothetical protein [Candidatus Shikimatogenerans bostrichidophilus]|uniref:hypothetical protein n=1 Tax=Candidatus Shikimatogenerans bostrichidophilus TaxID=2943807 RepID=UPI002966511F
MLNKKKIKKLELYKIYIKIKKKSKDNKGIISVNYNRIVKGVNIKIPIQKYLNILKYEKIYYDIYTGKILIDTYSTKIIKNKINNLINLLK